MTEHTSGPWVFAYGSVYQGEDAETIEEFSGRIAQMDRDNPHTMPTERDANARLIAAAPELLEACCKFVNLSNSLAVALTLEQTEESIRAFTTHCHAARAAIAKAKGQP